MLRGGVWDFHCAAVPEFFSTSCHSRMGQCNPPKWCVVLGWLNVSPCIQAFFVYHWDLEFISDPYDPYATRILRWFFSIEKSQSYVFAGVLSYAPVRRWSIQIPAFPLIWGSHNHHPTYYGSWLIKADLSFTCQLTCQVPTGLNDSMPISSTESLPLMSDTPSPVFSRESTHFRGAAGIT